MSFKLKSSSTSAAPMPPCTLYIQLAMQCSTSNFWFLDLLNAQTTHPNISEVPGPIQPCIGLIFGKLTNACLFMVGEKIENKKNVITFFWFLGLIAYPNNDSNSSARADPTIARRRPLISHYSSFKTLIRNFPRIYCTVRRPCDDVERGRNWSKTRDTNLISCTYIKNMLRTWVTMKIASCGGSFIVGKSKFDGC